MANSPTSTAGAGSWRCRFRAQARNDEKRGRSFAGWSSCGQRRGRKPLSVFESAIYLRNLPPGIGRAALICRYIWSCRPAAVPVIRRRMASWALTPRFHPCRIAPAVIFCYGRKRLLPSVLSTARRPALCGLSSPRFLRCARNDRAIPGMTARQIVPPFSVAKVRKKLYFCPIKVR